MAYYLNYPNYLKNTVRFNNNKELFLRGIVWLYFLWRFFLLRIQIFYEKPIIVSRQMISISLCDGTCIEDALWGRVYLWDQGM